MSSRLSRRGIRVSTKPVPIDISIAGGVGFLDAFIAACAMIAHADEELAAEERRLAQKKAEDEAREAERQANLDAMNRAAYEVFQHERIGREAGVSVGEMDGRDLVVAEHGERRSPVVAATEDLFTSLKRIRE